MTVYKFLAHGRRGRFSDVEWPRDGWVAADAVVDECRSGVHACTSDQLVLWIDDELWEIELAGEVAVTETGVIGSRGRLLRKIDAWDEAAARAFAGSCADSAAARVAQARPMSVDGARECAALSLDCGVLATGARPDELDRGGPLAPVPTPAAVAANLGFVAAHVAGRVAALTGEAYARGFDDERARQRSWLQDRICS